MKKQSPEMSWQCLECAFQAAFLNKRPFDWEGFSGFQFLRIHSKRQSAFENSQLRRGVWAGSAWGYASGCSVRRPAFGAATGASLQTPLASQQGLPRGELPATVAGVRL